MLLRVSGANDVQVEDIEIDRNSTTEIANLFWKVCYTIRKLDHESAWQV
jgi:hypothetical protein